MYFPETEYWKFKAEVAMWSSLRHPNIVAIKAISVQKNNLIVVSEYMKEGSLSDFLRKTDSKLPKLWPFLFRISLDVCKSVSHPSVLLLS